MRGSVVPGPADSRLHDDGAGIVTPVLAKLTGPLPQGRSGFPGPRLVVSFDYRSLNESVHLAGRFVLRPTLPITNFDWSASRRDHFVRASYLVLLTAPLLDALRHTAYLAYHGPTAKGPRANKNGIVVSD